MTKIKLVLEVQSKTLQYFIGLNKTNICNPDKLSTFPESIAFDIKELLNCTFN